MAVAASCGGGDAGPGHAEVRARACADAAAGLRALPQGGGRDRVALAAGAATTTLTDLADTLAAQDVPPAEAAAQANLRNAVAGVASAHRNLEAVLRAGTTGGLELLVPATRRTYATLQAAADALDAPDCGAAALGRDRFLAAASGAREPGAAPPLPRAARAACARIGEAYGPTAPAVDRSGATTQLERSRAVLAEVTDDLARVRGARAASLRTAVAAADRTLAGANRAVAAGADPTATSQRAFAVARGLLATGFSRAGVPCPALA